MNDETKIMLSTIRKAIPQMIAEKLVSVQPIQSMFSQTIEHGCVLVKRSHKENESSSDITKWCEENGIEYMFGGPYDFKQDVWKIPNDEHRLWFTLKWT